MSGAAVDNCAPKDGATIGLGRVVRKMIYPFGFKAERRSKPIIATFPVSYRSEVGLSQPTGRPEQRIEYGLKVKCRTTDDLKHVGSRGLLLQRLREQLSRVREFACSLVKLRSQVSCGGPLTGGSGWLLAASQLRPLGAARCHS